MPIDYNDYPKDWKTISQRIRFERAGGKCEWCGVEHMAVGTRDILGKWHNWDDIQDMNSEYAMSLFTEEWLADGFCVRIILTTAHLNHDVTNNRDENLAALCQKCHNGHDAKYRANNRRRNQDKVTGQLRMFEEAAR